MHLLSKSKYFQLFLITLFRKNFLIDHIVNLTSVEQIALHLKNNQNLKDTNNSQSEKTELKLSALNPLVGRKSKKTAPDTEPIIDN